MTPLRQQMTAALELNGKSPATIEAYVREVYLVSKFYAKRPDLISEEELERYLLHRKNIDHLAPTSMRICYSGIRFSAPVASSQTTLPEALPIPPKAPAAGLLEHGIEAILKVASILNGLACSVELSSLSPIYPERLLAPASQSVASKS